MKTKLLLTLAAIAAVAGIAQATASKNNVGTQLPEMTLSYLGTAPVLKGKPLIVEFWATWCPPCRKEFPSLGRVRSLFSPSDFEVIAVNVGEEAETVFSFAGSPEFPVLFDKNSQTMATWPVKGLPTTFLVDRQGRLALKAIGGREFDDPLIVNLIKGLF